MSSEIQVILLHCCLSLKRYTFPLRRQVFDSRFSCQGARHLEAEMRQRVHAKIGNCYEYRLLAIAAERADGWNIFDKQGQRTFVDPFQHPLENLPPFPAPKEYTIKVTARAILRNKADAPSGRILE